MIKFDLSEIINIVGSSKRKLITLIIMLVFMVIFYLSKELLFKADCSELITKNENILKNNIKMMDINSKVSNKNNILTEKIFNLEDILEEKENLNRSLNRRINRLERLERIYSEKNVTMNNSVNENIVKKNLDTAIVTSPNILRIIRSPRRTTINIPVDSLILDSLYEDSENIETDGIIEDEPKKVGFFKKLFGIKKKSDEILDTLSLD